MYYRYALYLGRKSDEYAANCTSELRLVGDWEGWKWEQHKPGVNCIDDEWLSVDLSSIASRLRRPSRVNITDRDGTLWGLHGNPQFLAPCLLSEMHSSNIVLQATGSGVRFSRLEPIHPDDEWILEPANKHLDVCEGGNVAVAPVKPPFKKR